jgi:hypothetical protein
MRDNWLSNRICKSCDDILDDCCFAWNRLTDQPRRAMSFGLRNGRLGEYQGGLISDGSRSTRRIFVDAAER